MELENGATPFSSGTYPCSDSSCAYCVDGRCVFAVAKVRFTMFANCSKAWSEKFDAFMGYIHQKMIEEWEKKPRWNTCKSKPPY